MSNFINLWASKVSEGVDFLLESLTPHEKDALLASFNHDVSDEKFTPTQEFLYAAYDLLNERLLAKLLPGSNDFTLEVKSLPRSKLLGFASYKVWFSKQAVEAMGITLNCSKTLTLHDWLGVVLHEMVHVVDYVTHPEHFLLNRKYDSHGSWFLTYGAQFESDGFHIQKYCTSDIGVSTEDKGVQRLMKRRAFMLLDGFKPPEYTGDPCLLVVSDSLVEKYANYIQEKSDRGYGRGIESITILKSKNPNIVRLKSLRLNDTYTPLKWYWFSEKFKQNYGPFEETGKIMINKPNYSLTEDKDEVEYDDMNHIDDEYARKIYDRIDGVVNVQKTGEDEYQVDIF